MFLASTYYKEQKGHKVCRYDRINSAYTQAKNSSPRSNVKTRLFFVIFVANGCYYCHYP